MHADSIYKNQTPKPNSYTNWLQNDVRMWLLVIYHHHCHAGTCIAFWGILSIIIKVLTYLSPLYVLGWVVAVSCRSHPKRIKWLCFEILKLSILARISYTLVPEMRWIHTQRVTPFYSLSHLLSLSVELTTEETSSPSTEWESWAKWWDEWFLSCRTQTDTWRHIEWNNDYQIGLGTNSFSWCQFYRCIRELMPD